MLGITGACCRIIGDLVQSLGKSSDATLTTPESDTKHQACVKTTTKKADELMMRALRTVFGMESNGKIKKEKARRVVERLGLVKEEEEEEGESKFELPGSEEDEVAVEEALGEAREARGELLREAFRIFDEDGNGYIDAVELKRVLECLGLDKGLDMVEVEKMLSLVDLNFDGLVDFGEFELMMAS